MNDLICECCYCVKKRTKILAELTSNSILQDIQKQLDNFADISPQIKITKPLPDYPTSIKSTHYPEG